MRPGAVLSPLPENKKKRSKRSRTSDKSKAGATGNTAHPTEMGVGVTATAGYASWKVRASDKTDEML